MSRARIMDGVEDDPRTVYLPRHNPRYGPNPNAQALATADAIADAERTATQRERERCLKIVRAWIDLHIEGKVSPGDALEGIRLGVMSRV